jgi:hypothetical protein
MDRLGRHPAIMLILDTLSDAHDPGGQVKSWVKPVFPDFKFRRRASDIWMYSVGRVDRRESVQLELARRRIVKVKTMPKSSRGYHLITHGYIFHDPATGGILGKSAGLSARDPR